MSLHRTLSQKQWGGHSGLPSSEPPNAIPSVPKDGWNVRPTPSSARPRLISRYNTLTLFLSSNSASAICPLVPVV